jgi:tetratricopeptide (TPR) repeat protein
MNRLLSGFALLLVISTAAFAQAPAGTIKRFAINSTVLGEERVILVRTPVGYERNNLRYPVLYMTDGDAHMVLRSHYFGLRKVYEGWQAPNDPRSGAITGGLKGADAHYKKLSEKFGYPITVPENVINQIGYQYLFDGKSDDAIATFKTNVERYPMSANVYDSLAEAYERGGRNDLAEPLYDKAQTLGQQNNDPNAAVYKANYERVHSKVKQTEASKKQQ